MADNFLPHPPRITLETKLRVGERGEYYAEAGSSNLPVLFAIKHHSGWVVFFFGGRIWCGVMRGDWYNKGNARHEKGG